MDKIKHLISKYLEDELDPSSRVRFEEDLKNDPVLMSEFNLYKEVNIALIEKEAIDLRIQLREIHEEVILGHGIYSRQPVRRILRFAAAAVFLAALVFGSAGLYRYWSGSHYIIDKFYVPYEMTMINRSENSEINLIMQKALEYYENKEYREAVVTFEKVLELDPDQMASRLYSGISFFEIREYQKASNSFNQIIEHRDNLYIEQAEWYLGFCFVMMDEKARAVRQFKKIAGSDGYYSEKAKEVINKLK